MTYASPIGRVSPLVNAAVALVVTAATIAMIGAHPFEGRGAEDLDALAVALAALAGLSLFLRHASPLGVLGVSTAAGAALALLGYAPVVHLAPAVALATVASRSPRDHVRWAAIVAAAGWGCIALSEAVVVDPRGDFVRSGLLWAGAWILGDRRRQQRQRMVDLAERAERAERETERERALAAAEEREHIARELHDSAGHAINVILVQAGAARLWHERDPQRTREALEAVEKVAHDTLTEIDGLVGALRGGGRTDAAPLPGLGDLDALIATHRAGGLDVTDRREGATRPLAPAVDRAAYRIAQEALTNAAKHGDPPSGGQTASADLVVGFAGDALELTVTNPATREASPRPGGGHGIAGMRERATLLGGALEAGHADGTFRVHARLPYDRDPR